MCMFTKIENIKKEGTYLVLGSLNIKKEGELIKFKISDDNDIKKDTIYGVLESEVEERDYGLFKVEVQSASGYKKGDIVCFLDDEVEYLVDKVQSDELKAVIRDVFKSQKEEIAKARVTQMSCYSKPGELIEHLLKVSNLTLKVAESIELIYGEKVDKDLLLVASILHDIGKAYSLDENGKTKEGLLLGDTLLTLKAVEPYMRKLDEDVRLNIEHIICSCKNEPNHGAIVIPRTKEAIVFALIEKLDTNISNFTYMQEKNIDTLFSKKYVL